MTGAGTTEGRGERVVAELLPGSPMPGFRLPDASGIEIDSGDYRGLPAFVVAFLDVTSPACRRLHRPFSELAWELRQEGVAIVAINPTAPGEPAEASDAMDETAREAGLMVPYLVDSSQDVARRFGVRRVPDFFVFDGAGRLRYHGRFDASDAEPGTPTTGVDLRRAVRRVLEGQPVPPGSPSMGAPLAWSTQA